MSRTILCSQYFVAFICLMFAHIMRENQNESGEREREKGEREKGEREMQSIKYMWVVLWSV